MIEQLVLDNFQSHEESVFIFGPGINTIIGSSNNGKSAVLRGLRWLLFNKPNGIGFVSHWNLTDKGVLKKATQAHVVLSGGIGITRYRTKDENSYRIGEKKLEAIGQDLPEEVAKLLNLTDVNFQNQLDAHFLLSESAGEVARFFNRTIRLDIIDTLLAAVESKKRKNKAEVEALTEAVKAYGEELEGLSWLETADGYLAKAEVLDEKVKAARKDRAVLDETFLEYVDLRILSRSIDMDEPEAVLGVIDRIGLEVTAQKRGVEELSDGLSTFTDHQATLDGLAHIGETALLVTELELVAEGIEEAKEQVGDLESDLVLLAIEQKAARDAEKVPDIDGYLDRIEEKQTALALDRGTVRTLQDELETFEDSEEARTSAEAEIERLEATLPELCPMCGNPWDGADHDHGEAK
jgi:exonuclease SbcC